MTQYISSNCFRVSERLGEQAWAVTAGHTFPHVNQAFLTLKRLFIMECGDCRADTNALQWHRCPEWFQLSN